LPRPAPQLGWGNIRNVMIEQQNTIVVVASELAVPGLPGRPMADLGGVPLVLQAWRRAGAAKLGHVLIAAAELAVAEAVKQAGGDAIVTAKRQASIAHRAAAALALRDPEGRYAHVVIFADHMPFPDETLLQRCLAGLTNEQVDVATLAAADAEGNQTVEWRVTAPLGPEREVAYARKFEKAVATDGAWRHVPIWAFRRAKLEAFATTGQGGVTDIGPRLLELAWPVAVVRVDRMPLLVEDPAGLDRARAYLKHATP
jgi:3-deoxy-manno-octulosonate cytidylyltransferase (CMP-KDO synthetase)